MRIAAPRFGDTIILDPAIIAGEPGKDLAERRRLATSAAAEDVRDAVSGNVDAFRRRAEADQA